MNTTRHLEPLRVALGFFLTPAIPSIVMIAAAYLATEEHQGECPFGWVVGITILFLLPRSYLGAIVLGLPYVLVLQKSGHLNFWTIMAAVCAAWVLAIGLRWRPTPDRDVLELAVVIGSLVGVLLAGALFFLIAVWGDLVTWLAPPPADL